MKIGVQGERGSACDAAAVGLTRSQLAEVSFEYFPTAEKTLAALEARLIDGAILALESPLGIPVPETSEALASHPPIIEVAELRSEVRHCIMVRRGVKTTIRRVASHPIPLRKHREFLFRRFPDYEPLEVEDTGLAARLLSEGKLSDDTAVIAMPHAAEIFNLEITDSDLPANDGYLTRFALVRKAFPSLSELKRLAEQPSQGVPHYMELDTALRGDDVDTAKRFYDDDAKENRYLVEVQRFVPNYPEMAACIAALAVAEQPRLVLDAGLGPGTLALEILQQTNARLVGIDLSKEMAQWATSVLAPAASRVQLIVGDVNCVALPGPVDVIITNLMMHNLAHQQKEELLGRFFDSLAAGRLLLWGDTVRAETAEEQNLTDWFRWKWAREHGANQDHIKRTFRKERKQDQPWTISRMEQALRQQGFAEINVEYAQLGMGVLSARKPS